MTDRKRVVIESPYGSRPDGTRCAPEEMAENVNYLKRCIVDSLMRFEAPFARHGFYPLVLDDRYDVDRRAGMESGFAWGAQAELVAVYMDRGVTPGMQEGIDRHRARGIPVVQRWLDEPNGAAV